MELIHIANATFSSLSQRNKNNQLSLENLASKQKLSRLLKSRRCAHRHRRQIPLHQRDHASTQNQHVGLHELASSHGARGGGGLVEPAGIEPATSCLQSRRSPS